MNDKKSFYNQNFLYKSSRNHHFYLLTTISIFLSIYIYSSENGKEMETILQSWPEPVVRVQSLSDSGINAIPECYIKAIHDRPSSLDIPSKEVNIPIINLAHLSSDNPTLRKTTMNLISDACRQWGIFQVINHGVSHHLMAETRRVWREFFHCPLDMKQKHANSPTTYEGYGSRLGVEKGAKLDWSDYFFLHFLPVSMRDERKWPEKPSSCR